MSSRAREEFYPSARASTSSEFAKALSTLKFALEANGTTNARRTRMANVANERASGDDGSERASEQSARECRIEFRCLMDKYFNPLIAHAREKEINDLLGMLKITFRKVPKVFELGGGLSAVRVFAHAFALTAASGMRAEFHESVISVLIGLMSIASQRDRAGMHELCSGCVELVCDAKKILELFQERQVDGGREYDDGIDGMSLDRGTVVLCCFDAALAHVKRNEEVPNGGAKNKSESGGDESFVNTGLMIEVQSLECLMNITNAACQMLECALRTNQQNVAPLTTNELIFALAQLLEIGSHDVQLAAAAVLHKVIIDVPTVLVPSDTILASIASVLTRRPLRKDDKIILQLVYTLRDVAGAEVLRKHADVLTTSVLRAIDLARDDFIRGVLFDTLRIFLLVRPSLAIQAVTLIPHSVATHGTDALIACLALAFSNPRENEGDRVEQQKRLRADETNVEHVTLDLDYKAQQEWIESCILTTLEFLGGPESMSSSKDVIASQLQQEDSMDFVASMRDSAPSDYQRIVAISVIVRSIAASNGSARVRSIAAQSISVWLRWIRKYNGETQDPPDAQMYALLAEAANTLVDVNGDNRDDKTPPLLSTEDIPVDILTWPWSSVAMGDPEQQKTAEQIEGARFSKLAALKLAVSLASYEPPGRQASSEAARRVLSKAFLDQDAGVRSAAAIAVPFVHVLASTPPSGHGALNALSALQHATEVSVRIAFATSLGGLAAAGVLHGIQRAAGNDVIRGAARQHGNTAVTAACKMCNVDISSDAGKEAAKVLADSMQAFHIAVMSEVNKPMQASRTADSANGFPKTPSKFNRNRRRLTGTPVVSNTRPEAKSTSLSASLTLQDLNSKKQLESVIVGDLSRDPDGLVTASGLRSLRYALEVFSAAGDFNGDSNTLEGAKQLAISALETAHHHSRYVREALCEAASVIASDDILLEMAPPVLERPEDRRRSSSAATQLADALHHAQQTAGVDILRILNDKINYASDSFIKESALRTFAAVAETLSIQEATEAAVMVYFKYITDKDLTAQNCAIYLLRRLAKKRKVRTRELLLGMENVAAHLGCLLPENPLSIATLAELARMTPTELLKEILPLSMRSLIRKAIERRTSQGEDLSILQKYATLLDMPLDKLILEYSYQAIAESINPRSHEPFKEQEKREFQIFLEKYSNDHLLTLIASQKIWIMRALIIRAGAENDDMTGSSALMWMTVFKALADAAQPGVSEVSDFFRPHFTRMEMQLYDKNGDTLSHKRYIRSLTIMVWMIGKHLPQFAPKVMAHLAHALNDPELRRTALESWRILVQVLSEEPRHLQRAAGQIVVAMLPYLDPNAQKGDNPVADRMANDDANRAAAVIDELVLRKSDVMRGRLATLPMLPAVERLQAANARIAQERGQVSLSQLFASLTVSLMDESLAVRATALAEIRRRVSSIENLAEIQDLIQGVEGTAADPVVSSMVEALLKCCEGEGSSETSRRVQRAAAQCLSELGAIDPGRLLIAPRPVQTLNSEHIVVASTLLVDHLVRTVRGANDSDMLNAAAYAVQRVLFHVGCRPEEVNEDDALGLYFDQLPPGHSPSGVDFWESLPDEARVVLAPCLTSMYSFDSKLSNPKHRPLYNSSPAVNSFNKWIIQWCRILAYEATGQSAPLFIAACGVFRHDIRIALFLLPYMVLDAILESDERRDAIKDEIVAVLRDAAGGDSSEDSANVLPGTSMSHGRTELAAQTIFALLDQLKGWSDANKTKDPESVNIVREMLQGLSFTLEAKAAQRCGASARALMYFEDYLRANKMTLNQASSVKQRDIPDTDVSFLATIYQGLAESDALASIPRLRATPQPEDQLLQHEEAGEWEEALVHYESSLQRGQESMSKSSVSVAEWGRLRCLQGLGHLRAVQREVQIMIRSRPDAPPTLAEAGAAAAWRLGQWDDLDSFLSKIDTDASNHVNFGLKRSHRQTAAAPSALSLSGVPLTVGGGVNVTADVPQLSADAAIGRVLLALQKNDGNAFQSACASARDAVITPLRAASMEGSYLRAHAALVQLHLLQEAESAWNAVRLLNDAKSAAGVTKSRVSTDAEDIPYVSARELSSWGQRLVRTPPNMAAREPILALRRTVYKLLGAKAAASNTWLEQARVARKAGHYGAAQLALLETRSETGMSVPLALEQAKLLWAEGRPHRAVLEVEEALKDQLAVTAHPQHAAKALLKLAQWSAVTGQKQKTEILRLYESVIQDYKSWEKSHFHVARYMDEWMKDATKRELGGESGANIPVSARRKGIGGDDEEAIDYLTETVREYGNSIKCGHRHIYESLPRMLTLWFDTGDRLYAMDETEMSSRNGAKLKKIFGEVMSAINGFSDQLPLYKWLTALPQLTSRLSHNEKDVRRLVQTLVTRLLINFPDQVLWALVPMARSRDLERATSAKKIITDARNGKADSTGMRADRELITQFAQVADQLVKLCNYTPKPMAKNGRMPKSFSLLQTFPELANMMPTRVMIPTQRSLTATLPPSGTNPTDHKPFPTRTATLFELRDEVSVLASLQRPKKLTLIGNDYQDYAFLCKPKDDLRKDLRMMEFTTMLNRLLARDPESRKRRLYLRTFSVIPLTEDCGIIEWVPHTLGFRHIIQELYQEDGLYNPKTTNVDIKQLHERCKGRPPASWMKEVVSKHPPVFHRWFLDRWKEPAAWFAARTAFAHTTAVWSMVGHVVGLGDRHGENILFDCHTGDAVHVDFSCLFDKGLTLETPEKVPFRLTQNLVDGLGVGGYEGVFMRVCEITLTVLRSHREALMSVLETFVHDPLVEWTKSSSREKGNSDSATRGKDALEKIQSRLEGVVVGVGAAPSMPLSPQGQARRLVEEAVSLSNLGSMYIWWMAWH